MKSETPDDRETCPHCRAAAADLPYRRCGGSEANIELLGRVVRIGTALGTFVVEIVNELGLVADELADEIEQCVLDRIKAHRDLVAEMSTVEVQRGELDYRLLDL
jgi:hypothetical protein